MMKRISMLNWGRLMWPLLLILVSACGVFDRGEPEPTPVVLATSLPTTPLPTVEGNGGGDGSTNGDTVGTAFIEGLRVSMLAAAPVQVQVIVNGSLSDGCTAVSGINVQQNTNSFDIQVATTRDANAVCTQALVPFEQILNLDVQNLPAGTYTVTAGDLSQAFTLTADNAPPAPTPVLGEAALSVNAAAAMPGQTVNLNGAGFPPGQMVQIGIGPVDSEYDVISSVQVGADGTFTSPIVVPTYVGAGESWVFVAVLADAKVTAAPILITAAASNPTAVPAPPNNGVNVPVNGQFTRTNMYLIALEDNGQSGEMIGCNDSVIPVIVDIEPTVAPLTAVLNRMLGLNDQFYGESGLYNAFYQSDLSVQGINIVNRQAVINLTGTLQLGGTCDGPRVRAQLEKTALQYGTVDSVAISINGQSLDSILSGQ